MALIISDFLAPFFIWPHWTGRFYPSWAVFFSSGLSHWLQALALALAWPVLRDRMRGRLCLALIAGLHQFLPPPTLSGQFSSSLAAAAGWWLAALPGALAVSRKQPEGLMAPDKPAAETGAGSFQMIVWLTLAAHLIPLLIIFGPALASIGPAGGLPSGTLGAALAGIAVFPALLAALLLAGRGYRFFSAPVYLAALISLGGMLWLWPEAGLTESALSAFLTGLLAIHITLLPILGALVVVMALVALLLRRHFAGRGSRPALIKSGLLQALALLPIAGLGLATIPLWADHISRSYLEPPPALEPYTLLTAGTLVLPVPNSLKPAGWATFIKWMNHEAENQPADFSERPLRAPQDGKQEEAGFKWSDYGLILLETEFSEPSLAGQEFEAAWQSRLKRGPERKEFPKSMEDLSGQFGRPSRLLIHYHRPRHAKTQGSMVMRLAFFQQRSGAYLRLMDAMTFETENLEPAELERLQAEAKADFLKRAGETAAAYRWGRVKPGAAGASDFMTRCGRLDRQRLSADLEARLKLARADDPVGQDWRGGEGSDLWIRSRDVSESGDSRPAVEREDAPGASARLEPLLGRVSADRPRLAAGGRNGWEYISIEAGGRPGSPASIIAVWSSVDGGLEVEMRSDRRLVQAELPALTWLWSEMLGNGSQAAGLIEAPEKF